ncbi:MAG: GNAT family N-acetyltransferase [Saprospiraceae bacterium]
MQWTCKSFDELSKKELYSILALRQETFVVEQYCPYLDVDGKDIECFHLIGTNENNELLAYSRLIPKDLSYPNEISIGRIISSGAARGGGYGRALMEKSIKELKRLFGEIPIRIGAQCYLKGFYEKFGFQIASPIYLEDGIPHQEMVYFFEKKKA